MNQPKIVRTEQGDFMQNGIDIFKMFNIVLQDQSFQSIHLHVWNVPDHTEGPDKRQKIFLTEPSVLFWQADMTFHLLVDNGLSRVSDRHLQATKAPGL